MLPKEKLGIGCALILLAGCGQPAQDAPAHFREATVDGRFGFKLLIPEATWKHMTRHASGLRSVLLDKHVHATVEAMSELGIQRRHVPCPHQWIMREIGSADVGGVLFIGICATPAEMKAAGSQRIAGAI